MESKKEVRKKRENKSGKETEGVGVDLDQQPVKCESCLKLHDGKFGSGRFCSKKCANLSGGLAIRKKREKEFLEFTKRNSALIKLKQEEKSVVKSSGSSSVAMSMKHNQNSVRLPPFSALIYSEGAEENRKRKLQDDKAYVDELEKNEKRKELLDIAENASKTVTPEDEPPLQQQNQSIQKKQKRESRKRSDQ